MVSPTGAHWRLTENPWRLAYPDRHVLNDPSQYQLSWVIHVEEHTDARPDERFSGRGRFQTQDLTVSADGIHWRRLNCRSLPSGDEANLSYDEAAGTFLATLKEGEMGPYGRSVALATSPDFEHWNGPSLIFHADQEDQQLARQVIAERLANPRLQQPQHNVPAEYMVDVYNMGVSRYEGLYIGMAAFFYHTGNVNENSDGFHHVQLVCSRDLASWKRLGDRRPFIGPSETGSGACDLSQIMPPSRPVLVDGELWFYYMGAKYRSAPPDADEKTGAIHLATMRRDGFMSLDAGAEEGVVTTDRFALQSPWLCVNVDAGRGSLVVEVVDEGSVVARSREVRGDQLRYPVQWETGGLQTHTCIAPYSCGSGCTMPPSILTGSTRQRKILRGDAWPEGVQGGLDESIVQQEDGAARIRSCTRVRRSGSAEASSRPTAAAAPGACFRMRQSQEK